MEKTLTVLVTGGIGCGKSNIVKAFNSLGIPSYDCDAAAKRLYDTDAVLLAGVVQAAGADVLKDGKIDRRALADKIFADAGLLERINALVHPAVIRDFNSWKASCRAGCCILESAILLENPAFDSLYDRVVAVSAPEEIRVQRTMARDGATRESVLERMSRQWTDSRREERADFVIVTDDRHPVLPELINIVEKIKNGKDRS